MTGNTDMHLLVTDTLMVGSLDRVDQAVDCGLECCPTHLQWLCEVDGYWRKLEHAVVQVDTEHSKRAQLVACLVSVQAMEELGHFQLPGIVYRSLRHGGCAL